MTTFMTILQGHLRDVLGYDIELLSEPVRETSIKYAHEIQPAPANATLVVI